MVRSRLAGSDYSTTCLMVLVAAVLTSDLNAQTWRTITGTSWSSAANWGGVLPTNDGTADLVFSQVGDPLKVRGSTVMDQNWNVRSLYWNPTSLDMGVARIAEPYQGSTTLTLQAGLTNASGGRVEISPDIVLGAVQTWHDNSTPTSSGSNTPGTQIWGSISGAGGIVKTGSGTLRFGSATNSYTGGTTIKEGVLEVAAAGALGHSSSAVTLDGGILRFISGNSTISTVMPQDITLAATGGSIQLRLGEVNLNGTISGTGQLRLERDSANSWPASRFTLSSTNSHSGGTVLGAVTVNIAGTGQAFGTGEVSLQDGAVLRLNAETNLAPGRKVRMTPGSVFVLNSAGIDPAAVIDANPAQTTGGTLSIELADHSTALDMAVIGNGRLFLGSSGDVIYSASTLGPGSDGVYRVGGGNRSSSNIEPKLTFSGTDNLFTGARSLTVGGEHVPPTSDARHASWVILKNSNNHTGGTTIVGGNLGIGHNNALGSGTLTLAGGALSTDGAARSIPNPILATFAADSSFAFAGTHKLTLDGTVDLGGASRLFRSTNSVGVTFANEIRNGGLALTEGLWFLTAANTFSGGLNILPGATVEVESDSNLGAPGGSLKLDRATLRPTASFSSNRPLAVDRFGGTIDTNGETLTLSGAVTGGELTKIGEGTLELEGTEKTLSTLLISAGTVEVNNNGNNASMLVGVRSGGTLSGNGSVGRTSINPGGHLAPGTEMPGQLRINSGLTLRAGAVLDFDLGLTLFDRILLGSGSLIIDPGNPVMVNISDAGGIAPNQTYTLLDWDGASSVYGVSTSVFQLGNSPLLGHFSIVQNTLRFTTVPEPASAGLLGMGALLLLGRRKRG